MSLLAINQIVTLPTLFVRLGKSQGIGLARHSIFLSRCRHCQYDEEQADKNLSAPAVYVTSCVPNVVACHIVLADSSSINEGLA